MPQSESLKLQTTIDSPCSLHAAHQVKDNILNIRPTWLFITFRVFPKMRLGETRDLVGLVLSFLFFVLLLLLSGAPCSRPNSPSCSASASGTRCGFRLRPLGPLLGVLVSLSWVFGLVKHLVLLVALETPSVL